MTLIVSFFDTLAELARKSTAEMQTKIASIQEVICCRVNVIYEKLNERKNRTTSLFDFEY